MMVHWPQEGQGYYQKHNTMNPTLRPSAIGPKVQGRPHVRKASDSGHNIH